MKLTRTDAVAAAVLVLFVAAGVSAAVTRAAPRATYSTATLEPVIAADGSTILHGKAEIGSGSGVMLMRIETYDVVTGGSRFNLATFDRQLEDGRTLKVSRVPVVLIRRPGETLEDLRARAALQTD